MSCNCVNNKQVEELYRQFGQKIKPTGKETFKFKLKKFLTEKTIILIEIVSIPFLLFYVIYKHITKGRISIAEFLGYKKLNVNNV